MARENSSHAPGSDSAFGGERQRHMMGEGSGPMPGGTFGVSSLPGTARIKGDTSDMSTVMPDRDRGCGPCVSNGSGKMRATAAPDHGDHGYKAR